MFRVTVSTQTASGSRTRVHNGVTQERLERIRNRARESAPAGSVVEVKVVRER